jgi:BlaI family transcriptional regulator, penicillinase repressor
MRVLWKRGPLLAADVAKVINRHREQPLAYTTVLNVLLNLEKKGVVDHTAEGRAYRFAPTLTEAQLHECEAKRRSRDLLDLFAGDGVAAFVSEVRSDPVLDAQFRELLEEGDDEGGRP